MVSLFTELASFRADNIICIELTHIAAILSYIALFTESFEPPDSALIIEDG